MGNLQRWSRVLEVTAICMAALALFLGLANQTAAFKAVFESETLIGVLGPAARAAELGPFKVYMYGVLGGTTFAYAALVFVVARFGFARGERWAWPGLLVPTLFWYALDSGGSVAAGVWLNAVGNTALLGLILAPLLACAKRFLGKGDRERPTRA
jgi:hypothetical protein